MLVFNLPFFPHSKTSPAKKKQPWVDLGCYHYIIEPIPKPILLSKCSYSASVHTSGILTVWVINKMAKTDPAKYHPNVFGSPRSLEFFAAAPAVAIIRQTPLEF